MNAEHQPHDPLDALWPVHAPPPDFADRVLRACAPPAPRRSSHWLLLGALAAVALLVPLVLLHAGPLPNSIVDPTAHASAQLTEPDLGLLHD